MPTSAPSDRVIRTVVARFELALTLPAALPPNSASDRFVSRGSVSHRLVLADKSLANAAQARRPEAEEVERVDVGGSPEVEVRQVRVPQGAHSHDRHEWVRVPPPERGRRPAGRYDEPPERNSVEGSSGTSVWVVTASQIVHSRLPGTAIRREHSAQGRKRCRLVIVRTIAFVRPARRTSLRASLRVTAASTLPSTHRVVRPSSRPRHGAERPCISAERASPDRRARPHPMKSRPASPVVGRRDDLEPDGCAGWEHVHRPGSRHKRHVVACRGSLLCLAPLDA
jgi:hypothetical protein